MNILYICNYYKPAKVYGGPVQSVSGLCEGLVSNGVEVTVYTTNANGRGRLDVPLNQELNLNDVKVYYHPVLFNGYYFLSHDMTVSILRNISNFDIVFVDTLWGYAFHSAAIACIKNKKPYIVPLHGQLQPWALRQNYLIKRIYLSLCAKLYMNRAAALHCTDYAEVKAAKHLEIKSPAFIVPNGIDTQKFNKLPTRGILRNRYQISQTAIVLLFLGRLTRIKRADIAIDVLAQTCSMGINTHLIIVGPDEEGIIEELQEHAKVLGCGERVHFTGLLEGNDLMAAYSDADIFIMPTEVQENFGMAALEAMAAGLPILVSEGVPVGRWAEKFGAGMVLPCQSAAFTEAVLELINTSNILIRFGEQGRLLAQRKFDISIISKEMYTQLNCILETGRPQINNYA